MKAEQLRKAILQMAIQGKLVPQDPNDEPASALLEKIRAEKQKLIKEGKIKKDKVDSVIFRGEDNRHYEKVGNNAPVCIEDELPFEIPDSWEWVRLKEIVPICTGKKDANFGDAKGKYDFFTCSMTPIKSKTFSYSGEYLIMPGNGANVGLSIHYKGEFEAYQRTYLLEKAFQDINFEYLQIVMLALWKDYNRDKQYGSAIPYIKLGNLENFCVPIPPLTEQSRIVSEIEKYEPLIAEYDKLEQQKSKLDGELYDKLKKSILQYAIQGKLVPQDERDEPASELLKRIRAEKKAQLGKKYVDSYIYKGDDNCYYEHIEGKAQDEAIETPFDLPNNWTWARWGELSYSIQYGYNAPVKTNGRIKMVRISDIHNNEVDWANVPFCDIAEKEISAYLLKENDILFARTGGTVGKSYLVTVVPEEAIYAGYLIRTRYSSELSAQYLKFFMESSLYWDQLRDGTIATAQPNCNGQTLSKMLLPIPPLAEQKRIVNKINKIFVKL